MNLIPFESWADVMLYARTGQPLYYQAPMDHKPTRLNPGASTPFSYKVQKNTIRIWPHGSVGRGRGRTSDPFTADAGHLDRFSHPIENELPGRHGAIAHHRQAQQLMFRTRDQLNKQDAFTVSGMDAKIAILRDAIRQMQPYAESDVPGAREWLHSFKDQLDRAQARRESLKREYSEGRAHETTMRSRRQPSLPGFPDIPDPIDVQIPTMPWTQIGGDMDPGTYGGLIATADGDHIELLQIQPVREYVRDKEAAEVGFPFWTKEGYYDLDDLNPEKDDVKSALQYAGFTEGEQKNWFEEEATPEQRALAIAEALLSYGSGTDDGPSGWSEDLPDHEVKWWGDKIATLPEYLADEDEAFKQDVLGYGEIQEKLESEVQNMVDENAAQGWSNIGDQDMMDLEKEGYDDQSAIAIGEFGDAIAVNTELTADPSWAREMGYQAERDIFIWSEMGTAKLESWLEKNGYEVTDRGGSVPSVEGYAWGEHVIERVARDLDVPIETVEDAAAGLDWWGKGQEIPGSTDGYVTVWAKPLEAEEEEVEETPRRRRPARRRR